MIKNIETCMRNGHSDCRDWINKGIRSRTRKIDREREEQKKTALDRKGQTRIRPVAVIGRIGSQ